ncbi:Bromodomain-containing protein, partial [Sporodiniella umbellata]
PLADESPKKPEAKRGQNPRKNDGQLKFCSQALKELKKSKYRDINFPFLQPVDVVALSIPDYVEIVKHPMDLSTIEKKLNDQEYLEPEDFEQDIRLMFNNCYLYNPPTLPVHKMGRQLEKVFDDKWAQRPPKTEHVPMVDDAPEEEFDEVLDEASEDERDQKIAELERHIATISQQIASIKSQKRKKAVTEKSRRVSKTLKEKKPVTKEKKRSSNVATSSTTTTTTTTTSSKKKEPKNELPEFTFDQKKDLSERINNLTGDGLNTVVSIIQSSMPNLDGVSLTCCNPLSYPFFFFYY